MRSALAVAAGLGLALSGCGGGGERLPPPPAASPQQVALRIVFQPTGPEGEELTAELRCPSDRDDDACRRVHRIPPSAFRPVPGDVACAQVYGGPERGRIEGTIGRRAVAAEFRRTNSCEIARYDEVAFLFRLAR